MLSKDFGLCLRKFSIISPEEPVFLPQLPQLPQPPPASPAPLALIDALGNH
ncbi:MAG: hypothetical protein F6K31_27350 [Symploca sp. SIO2G7]|nr:hypothetical protein [Symploca sp. SIO2G7]